MLLLPIVGNWKLRLWGGLQRHTVHAKFSVRQPSTFEVQQGETRTEESGEISKNKKVFQRQVTHKEIDIW